MTQPNETAGIENVVRTLATAGRSLRLYPPTSPLPQQSVEAAVNAIDAALENEPVLAITIARDGLNWHGAPLGMHTPGAAELADTLRNHGVAEIAFMPGVSRQDVMVFLDASSRDPLSVRDAGGLSALVVSEGVETIRIVDVSLTVVDTSVLQPEEEEDFDEFLRRLASDPEKLAVWLAAAAHGDPALLEEGLAEIAGIVGADKEQFLECLAGAFMNQEPDAKDALLGLATNDDSPVKGIAAGMFGHMESPQIAGSILEGAFGRNMLSLSTALTKLPLAEVTAQVRAEVQSMLPGAGHTQKESTFLDHMLEVRVRTDEEPALIDADSTYRAVAQAAALRDDEIERARNAVGASGSALNAAGVRTMLALLDQQHDFELYCSSAENLAGMVPKLIEIGDLPLAAQVLSELTRREVQTTGPWPELSARLRDAIAIAVGPRAMTALVPAVVADPALVPAAREIVRLAGEAAPAPLVAEAIQLKGPGLDAAEALLGRRIVDMLNAQANQAQWFQLGPIVSRLAREGDARSLQTIDGLLKRPDEQSRREVVTAIAAVGGPAALRLLTAALRDRSSEVAIVAARSLGRSGIPGAGAALATRLGELDVDNADFLLGRELIGALARVPGSEAEDALQKVVSRRALIKRGHFVEIQDLAKQALIVRQSGGAR